MSAVTDAALVKYLMSVLGERDISQQYADALEYRIKRYVAYLGGQAGLEHLAPDPINSWVKDLQSENYKPRTVRHYRDAVKTLWEAAFQRGDVDKPPHRLIKIRVPQQPVEAWSQDELRKLIGSIGALRGPVPKMWISKRDWFRAYFYNGYATGLRYCDLVNHARWTDLHGDVLSLTQKKTGYPVARRLTPQALESLEPLRDNSEYILPWPGSRGAFSKSFNRVINAAGLAGSPKFLRRTAGSIVERQAPGTGGQFLGHRDVQMFDRHYHDRSVSQQVPNPPPEI